MVFRGPLAEYILTDAPASWYNQGVGKTGQLDQLRKGHTEERVKSPGGFRRGGNGLTGARNGAEGMTTNDASKVTREGNKKRPSSHIKYVWRVQDQNGDGPLHDMGPEVTSSIFR